MAEDFHIDKAEVHRRVCLRMSEDYRERLAKARAGQFDSRDAVILCRIGEAGLIAYLEEQATYWFARALGMPDPNPNP